MLEGFRERKLDVTVALQELGEIAGSLGAKSLKERLDRELVKKLEEDRFHLVVVGEFNHGKSSFVNALLGETVLPTGVTPTTAAIHQLKYAEQPEATVVYQSGKRESLAFEEARKFAVGGGTSVDDVDYLEVGYPAALLKERILLVDTPGVNDLSLQRADITYSYIPRADAVLFLLDAGQILKESERQFLNEKLLKASRDKIVFVITKWDILNEDEKKEALAYARTQLANLVKEPVVFPISAEMALQGDGLAQSGMPELLAHLTDFLAEERGRILLDNALGEGVNVGNLLAKGVDARRRAMAMKSDELERRIKVLEDDLKGTAGTIEQRRMKIREEISGIKVGAQKDLEKFVDDTIRQLPNVIESAKQDDLRKFLPSFLEDTFRQWAEAESGEIALKLEALAEKTIALIKEDAHEATKRVGEALGHDVKKLDIQIDTFRYDAGIAAVLVLGLGMMFVNVMVGGLLTIAAPIMALVLRDRMDAEYKKRAIEQAPEVIKQAATQVGPKIDEMIEDFAKKLDAWVVTAGEELYREILEVLNAAREARAKADHDEAKAKTEVDEQETRLEAAKKRVADLRTTLWSPKDKLRIDASVTPEPPPATA
ncbi:MAG: dynamin family protein [Labilithrix sp.]|nr:dynamin family protein [Labilithrix sp.]MCW5814809.1 dynamin family protein [Labilithrix sp.]